MSRCLSSWGQRGAMADRVVVVGASGFGRECLDVLEAMRANGSDVDVIGVVDDAPSPANLDRLAARGVRHLGSLEHFLASAPDGVSYLVGIGNPAIRARLAETLDAAGLVAFTAAHPSATFGACALLGEGVVACAGVAVSTNVRLGRHVHLNPNATVGHDTHLREFVSVNPAATISGEVDVGAATLVGAGAIILQNLSVGERAVIGAGAVVTKKVPDDVVVVGVPGIWTKIRNDEGDHAADR